MPTFCSLPLPSYYSNNFAGKIDASLSIVAFSINDPDLPYMIYYLWIYVAMYEVDSCLVVIYACAKTTLLFLLVSDLVSDDSGSDRHCITRYVHRCLTV